MVAVEDLRVCREGGVFVSFWDVEVESGFGNELRALSEI
jgi:hypothetical protein